MLRRFSESYFRALRRHYRRRYFAYELYILASHALIFTRAAMPPPHAATRFVTRRQAAFTPLIELLSFAAAFMFFCHAAPPLRRHYAAAFAVADYFHAH